MRPPQPDRFVGFFTGQETVEKAGREAVSAADTIVNVKLARR